MLGQGGMAEVYDGVDLRLQRPVAVKLLLAHMALQPLLRARFEAEALSAARLSHPNVVSIYDTGEEEGIPFIVMERLPGKTLSDILQAGPMLEKDALAMAIDVLAALEAAHNCGIIHRDIKPSNILMTTKGSAKVADFGIAKTNEDLESSNDLTATNSVIGTPRYLAPERIEGKSATPASDIWSLGVVLYEALSGVKAFTGGSAFDVASAIKTIEPIGLEELNPTLASSTVEAVKKAMAKDPRDRFNSAGEMIEALNGVNNNPSNLDKTALLGAAAIEGALLGASSASLSSDSNPTQIIKPLGPQEQKTILQTIKMPKTLSAFGIFNLSKKEKIIGAIVALIVLLLLFLPSLLSTGSGSIHRTTRPISTTTIPTTTTTIAPTTTTTTIAPTTTTTIVPTTTSAPVAAPPPGSDQSKKHKGKH